MTVSVADYSLSIECSGGFAAVLTLVNSLPSSVALQRLTGASAKAVTKFRLTLAVFESGDTPVGRGRGGNQHG